jgi:hypothetical protein
MWRPRTSTLPPQRAHEPSVSAGSGGLAKPPTDSGDAGVSGDVGDSAICVKRSISVDRLRSKRAKCTRAWEMSVSREMGYNCGRCASS